MADLKAIQDNLNSDSKELERFMAEPVEYLAAQGLVLSDDMAEHIRAGINQYKDGPAGQEEGTAAERDRSLIRIVIEF